MNTNPHNKGRVLRKGKHKKTRPVSVPIEILWALIGLFLTVGGTFVQAYVINVPWNWSTQGLQIYTLGVNYQIGAVLLAGCLGGKNAGALSQIAYVVLGLVWLPVFSQGGGFGYLQEPSFGYLLGFIPGAWLCGMLAFQARVKLESLFFSCIGGLIAIHCVGVIYLIGLQLFSPIGEGFTQLIQEIWKYSFALLPGQIVVVCSVTVIAFFVRKLLFY